MKVKTYQHLETSEPSFLSKEVLKSLILLGQYGCYFEPLTSWVDLDWLKNNGYGDIATRIRELIGMSKKKLRFFVRFKRSTNLSCTEEDKDNLILSYTTAKELKNLFSDYNDERF